MITITPSDPVDGMMLRCGTPVVFRDLEPSDADLYPEFHRMVSARDRRLRFFSPSPISDRQIHRLTHFDAREAVARAAIGSDDGKLYGVSRLHRVDEHRGEFAVMVRSDVKGNGLGRRLLMQVIERAALIGVDQVLGFILPENAGMLALALELGFELCPDPEEPGVLRARLDLAGPVLSLAA